jgi:DNA-binding YbaB/EbfC family protein
MGMGNVQRMALQMQQELERVKAELAETKVEGTSGGGVVRAVVTGEQKVVSITIDPTAVDPDDVDMLQDLVAVAVNDALDESRRVAEQKMGAMQSLGGLGGLLGR